MRARYSFACLILFSFTAFANPAFQGKWKLDSNKSTSAQYAPGNLEQEIKMDGAKLTIKSNFDQPKNGVYPLLWVGVMTQELQLAADGSEVINHIGPFLHKSKTTIDGNKMNTDYTATVENGSVEGQWIRTLSADGKEMTLQILAKASDGRRADLNLLFKKK